MLNLVIQGPRIDSTDIESLALLTRARATERISATAFRLRAVEPIAQIETVCADAGLDYAYVPAGRYLTDFGLMVMDMDSTLITIECIDEIADLCGVRTQVAAITTSAMRGEIDYSESLRRRVQLLAGLEVGAFERIYSERLRLTHGAEAMLYAIRQAGLRTLLVSGGFSYFTQRLQQRLGLDAVCSNEPEIIDGRLTGRVVGEVVDGAAKARAVHAMRTRLGLRPEQVIGIGDGANDLPFLAMAGVSIAFHAKPAVRATTTHHLDHTGLEGVLALFE